MKTVDYSKAVASDFLVLDRNDVDKVVDGEPLAGFDIAALIMIIEAITAAVMDIMDRCNEPDNARIVRALKRPGLFNRARLRNHVRNHLHGTEWQGHHNDVVKSMINVTEKMDDDDVLEVVKENKGVDDYWLI